MHYYLYGIIHPKEFKTIIGSGLNEEDVFLIPHQNIGIIVSNYQNQGKDYVLSSRKNMLAHQVVLEKVMLEQDIVPLKFGTLATEEEIQQILVERNTEFEETLHKIKNKIEVNLKGVWKDLPSIFEEISRENTKIQQLKKNIEASGGLANQNILIEVGHIVSADLQKKKEYLGKELLSQLIPVSLDYKMNETQTDAMFFNVAFLLDKSNEAQFEEILNKIGEAMETTAQFKYVGPLAPYNFI